MVAMSLGSSIASASTITPTHDVHHITGSTDIDTIVPPSPTFCGMVTFIMDGNLNFTTNDNIGRLVNGIIHIGVQFIYDPSVSKWYPASVP